MTANAAVPFWKLLIGAFAATQIAPGQGGQISAQGVGTQGTRPLPPHLQLPLHSPPSSSRNLSKAYAAFDRDSNALREYDEVHNSKNDMAATTFDLVDDMTPEMAKTWLARGLTYLDGKGSDDAMEYLVNPDASTMNPKKRERWENVLTGKMVELPSGVEVDDHSGTPIGEGDSIGLVAAEVRMDETWTSSLPDEFRTGMFSSCHGECSKWPSAVRVSHTNAADTDLMRIALKIDTGKKFGVVDLHFTETVKNFAIADNSQLDAFAYSVEHGLGWALAMYPMQMAKMGYNAQKAKRQFGEAAKVNGPTGKDYYSLTPFQIGGEPGQAAGAMKWRLRPHQRTLAPVSSENDVKQAMRSQFIEEVSLGEVGFDLMIQVATDPEKHPINDASVIWDEDAAPWIKMGTVRIPRQKFPTANPADLAAGDAVGEGLWGRSSGPMFSSKELLFAPGATPHKPLGDINAFRSHFYPIYDEARQKHLLGKSSGQPAKCPFKHIMKWMR